MLCSNTRYTFNHYLTSKTYIEGILSEPVDKHSTENTNVISELRTNMKTHFARFVVPDKIQKFAQTAKDLSPDHMLVEIISNEEDLKVITEPLIENLVEIVADLKPGINAAETQMIGPSQPTVNLTPFAKNTKVKVQNIYFNIVRPGGKMKTQPQSKVRQPFGERIKNEVYDYVNLLQNSQQDIEQEVMMSVEGFDVAKWWNTYHRRFPHLAIAVKNLMCIPATSANCERSFSTLTDVITHKRHSLSADTTHMLTFIKHNLDIVPDYTVNKGRPQTVDEPIPGTSGYTVDEEDVEMNDDN